MRLGRWELRWNWYGWREDKDSGFFGSYIFAFRKNETVWWAGPLELWRYDV